ncbi:MAG: diaminopimelate decarboxylase [Methylophilaceae bacterium]
MNKDSVTEKNNSFFIEEVDIKIPAEKYGTPLYIYSKQSILHQISLLQEALSDINHLICFAVKSNSNLSILNLIKNAGCGFDIVSGGELKRVIALGNYDANVVFSGVGKSKEEIEYALEHNILAFNIESEPELIRLNNIAKKFAKKANISIRVNPNVDAKTHPYISTGLKDNKFGLDEKKAIELYSLAKTMDSINITGIDCHIGSQLTDLSPFEDTFIKLANMIDHLQTIGIELDHIDIGGGIGISYKDEKITPLNHYVSMIKKYLSKYNKKIILEPGRLIIGKAGILLTKVEYIKRSEHKNFIVVDAAMNDLMRPSLYGAHHNVINISNPKKGDEIFDIVGPICETGDFLAKDRQISASEDDLLAFMDAGAYGFSMSSNYNTRPKIAEILVDQTDFKLIRQRETFDDLIQHEIEFVNQKK